jgi:hypothetical protein
MSALTAFEVQLFRNGNWKIETITDSKELAVHQAEQAILNPAVRKVRVIQEAFDPESAEQKFRVVFLRNKQAAKRPAATPPTGQPAADGGLNPEALPKINGAPANGKPPVWARRGSGAIALALKFGAIVCAGIGMIIALRYFGASL